MNQTTKAPLTTGEALKIARDALQAISDTGFGWDGDCGVKTIADDALAATEAASTPSGEIATWQERALELGFSGRPQGYPDTPEQEELKAAENAELRAALAQRASAPDEQEPAKPYAFEFSQLMGGSMPGWETRIERSVPNWGKVERVKPLYTRPAPVAASTAEPVVSIETPKFADLLYLFGRAFKAGSHEQLVAAGNTLVHHIDSARQAAPICPECQAREEAGYSHCHLGSECACLVSSGYENKECKHYKDAATQPPLRLALPEYGFGESTESIEKSIARNAAKNGKAPATAPAGDIDTAALRVLCGTVIDGAGSLGARVTARQNFQIAATPAVVLRLLDIIDAKSAPAGVSIDTPEFRLHLECYADGYAWKADGGSVDDMDERIADLIAHIDADRARIAQSAPSETCEIAKFRNSSAPTPPAQPAPDLAARDDTLIVLRKISEDMRLGGASLPAPPSEGTIESALRTGLSIGLLLVEKEIDSLKSTPAAQGDKQ